MSWHQRGRYLNVTFCASIYNLSNRSSPHTMPAARPALFLLHSTHTHTHTHNSAVPPRRKPQLSVCAPAETLLQHVFLFLFGFFLSWMDATVNQLELTANSSELMSSPLAPLNVTSLPCVPSSSSRDRTRGGAARRRGSIVAANTLWMWVWVCLGLSTIRHLGR
ncbi:hypothetical protein BKA59DRAFT_254974 [Fusarium tricinctum]|uniref:Uncharacterized protein n=1 Tax=Fusarium tricinctum TaxID=61284 RepID=A0A8K0RUP0_9HYPO|nr:hypothetical protein BKA59DRAFT_254974 [Fusarium tricinctum]